VPLSLALGADQGRLFWLSPSLIQQGIGYTHHREGVQGKVFDSIGLIGEISP